MISKRIFTLILLSSWILNSQSQAQVSAIDGGTGLWGGMQSCPYAQRQGRGSFSISGEMKDLQAEFKKVDKDLKEKEREFQAADRKVKLYETSVKRSFNDEAFSVIRAHVTNNTACEEYFIGLSDDSSTGGDGADKPAGDGSVTDVKNGKGGKGEKGDKTAGDSTGGSSSSEERVSFEPFKQSDWRRACSDRNGNKQLNANICKIKDKNVKRGGYAPEVSACQENLNGYIKSMGDRRRAKEEKDRLEALKTDLVARYDIAKDQWIEDMRSQKTEGGNCIECDIENSQYSYESSKTDWGSTLLQLGLGLTSMYANYRSDQNRYAYNSDLGMPSQANYLGYLPGAMMTLNGVYGAAAGGRAGGTFGCAGGLNGNGSFNIGPNAQLAALMQMNPMLALQLGLNGNAGGSLGLNPQLAAQLNLNPGAAQLALMAQYGLLGNGLNGLGINGQGSVNPLLAAQLNLNPLAALLGANGVNGQLGLNNPLAQLGVNGQLGINNPLLGLNNMNTSLLGGNLGGMAGQQYQQQMLELNLQAQRQMAQLQAQQQQAAIQQMYRAQQEQAQKQQAAMELSNQIKLMYYKLEMLTSGSSGSLLGGAYSGGALLGGANLGGSLNLNAGLNLGGNFGGNLGGNFNLGNNYLGTSSVPNALNWGVNSGSMLNGNTMYNNNPIINGNTINGSRYSR